MESLKPTGVIFDLDGVIVSTDELHYQAWKQLADREGIPFDRVVNHRLRGVSRMESLAILLEAAQCQYDNAEKIAMADFKNTLYVASLTGITPIDILPGVLDVLAELKTRRIRTAIGSSSKNARVILTRLGLANAFDAIVDGNDISRSKPDPEVFLKAADRIGIPPSACYVVEDAVSGIAAAAAAGMIPIAIGDAIRSPEARFRLRNIKELTTLF
ncbi:MAG: beta-phosphoglucomutase [bacterium]